jgi:alkyl sulfatase BDS1-like metallo-beta-lactamase superfamily hydrolase
MTNAPFEAVSPATGPAGQLAHADHLDHSDRLVEKFYPCGENAWCLVGNGLSNQTFVRGPEGIIAIDTGECVEEMQSAIDALRSVTDEPIVACIYTHFHYVNGTRAILDESGHDQLPIYGHEKIRFNRDRYGTEVGPRITRGMVHQFGITLPADGEDGLVNVGLGRFFQNPNHRPYTPGHLPVTDPITGHSEASIAGLKVAFTLAPSDADDSITIWFPELKIAVNNLVWPALFNVFAIRGEEYRDPRILLEGLDHLQALDADELLGAHGPPLSGADEIRDGIIDYRDSIQFLWDQTVQGVNKGLSLAELTESISLPERFNRTYLTRQFYGVVEHHVKQIHAGLFGWFDEDSATLFPVPKKAEADNIVEAMGGAGKVRELTDKAMSEADYRWALRLGSWLCEHTDAPEDRQRLGGALRAIGQRTTSGNIRNWCLTRARELEGELDLSRFRQHRFRVDQVMTGNLVNYVHVLKVLLDAVSAADYEMELKWVFESGEQTGLRIRRGVAVPTSGEGASHELQLSRETWAKLLASKAQLSEIIASGEAKVEGDPNEVTRFFSHFEVKGLRS